MMMPASQAASTSVRAAGQEVYFYNAAVDQNIDSNAGASTGTAITWEPDPGGYQNWVLEEGGKLPGALIKNPKKNLCLQAPAAPGLSILLKPCNGLKASQRWELIVEGGETFIARQGHPGEVIQATGENKPVVLAHKTSDPLQDWQLVPA
ncbi:ricin-type beta-trefoil lectin domain protein [Streptomyces scopuliridis]|uniref:ricin-type beta-trefoil lectin domain protein n=1 Tax=Streptomyces scopuliridis TaxID=452529 RepID=UPI00341DBCD8